MSEKNIVPNKIKIENCYESYRPIFNEILGKIENLLKQNIHLPSNPTYKSRIKSFSSYYKKILRQKAEESSSGKGLVVLTDMIGIRVICAFVEDLALVEKQIVDLFSVKEIERKGAEQSFKEFGYESVHILVSIPENCLPETGLSDDLKDKLVCEIQIRTILQDAWAEVEHELVYKSEFNPFDKPLRRKLASINASLTLADIIFQEIRDYQKRLQSELGARRNSFYEKADEFSENLLGCSKPQGFKDIALETSSFSRNSIDDLILAALHEHNVGNFKSAIEIYTQIINSVPTPSDLVLSVIFKHRGMAYFAQNLYEEALSDFKKSIDYDPKCFKSMYYQGIVYSVQGKDQEAVACFDNSLLIDAFQSHVYYRRALSYYNMGEYSKSMDDVNSAIMLGLSDNDLNALKMKLVKKFDMGM
ncbi:(p)ppGpp synthetase [Treponema sp.]|uniref:(p)ppGpp synthetase n=1 Tax=Treponema sp. TaxID=166 RepID=UPI003F0F2011